MVAPFKPTARALADADVIVVACNADVPVTARALPPSVAPPSASDVPVATPSAGVTSVGDVENTKLVEVVPVVPAAVKPVMLLKHVIEALLQFVPPLATTKVPASVIAPVVALLGVKPVVPAEKLATLPDVSATVPVAAGKVIV